MEKTISANELRKNLSAVLREVNKSGDVVFVESPEEGAAAIISIEEYRQLRQAQERQRRRDAFAELERIRLDIDERLSDLTSEEREALIDEITKETEAGIVARVTAVHAE